MAGTPGDQIPTSNEDLGPGFRAFVITMIVVSTTVVGLRFWSRSIGPRVSHGKTLHRFWWDDWVALFALVSRSAPEAAGTY